MTFPHPIMHVYSHVLLVYFLMKRGILRITELFIADMTCSEQGTHMEDKVPQWLDKGRSLWNRLLLHFFFYLTYDSTHSQAD